MSRTCFPDEVLKLQVDLTNHVHHSRVCLIYDKFMYLQKYVIDSVSFEMWIYNMCYV